MLGIESTVNHYRHIRKLDRCKNNVRVRILTDQQHGV
jgi:hypothetical protein